uniref:H.sapiens 14A4BT DNA sequence n=1 Tax=Homo sapiens TaxID=9606 RepID=V9H1H1_HUMAN|nr:hypothetical protein - human [Homo sapiens]CAA51392.1 unnamed protein product [Homo sapiens]
MRGSEASKPARFR